MGAKTNGNDCKHEKGLGVVVYEEQEIRYVNENCIVSYHCAKGCGDVYDGEVVILPKETHDKRNAVVEAGKMYYDGDIKRLGSLELAVAYPHMCDLPPEVLKAIAALEGE